MAVIKRVVLGVFEEVSFPKLGQASMRAKIDTGAYSGAIHCTKIRLEETPKGTILHFSPFGHAKLDIAFNDFKLKPVKSSNGVTQKRYFIDTIVKIKGENYPITLSLANRSEMKWPVLIGRKFLRQNNFLVDVNQKA